MNEYPTAVAERPVLCQAGDGWNARLKREAKPLFTRNRPTREELVEDLRGLGFRVALEKGGEVHL